MNILIYLAFYIGYFCVCAAVVFSLRRQKAKSGQNVIKPEFSERFSPVKGAIYFALYWLVTAFAARLMSLSKIDFLIDNCDFFAYLFLAIAGAGIFCRFFMQSAKNVGKNFKENAKNALLIWAVSFLVMALTVIIIALCNIENRNQTAIEGSPMNAVCGFFAICIFGPFVEELAFRGILFRWLREYTVIFAYAASGLLFGLEHVIIFVINYGDFLQLVSAVPMIVGGIGYAVIYDKTKNIMFPIVLHIAYNIIFGFLI